MSSLQRNICIFCASSDGNTPGYLDLARQMGQALATKDIGAVFGGAKVGMMGALATATMAAGGRAIGVIPHVLEKVEVTNRDITELHIVANMHERKALLAAKSDAFIALPGGLGTLEEIFEALTWAQLRIHAKPCVFLNHNGFYDHIFAFLDHATSEGMLKGKNRALILVANTVEDALAQIEQAWAQNAPTSEKRTAGLTTI